MKTKPPTRVERRVNCTKLFRFQFDCHFKTEFQWERLRSDNRRIGCILETFLSVGGGWILEEGNLLEHVSPDIKLFECKVRHTIGFCFPSIFNRFYFSVSLFVAENLVVNRHESRQFHSSSHCVGNERRICYCAISVETQATRFVVLGMTLNNHPPQTKRSHHCLFCNRNNVYIRFWLIVLLFHLRLLFHNSQYSQMLSDSNK